jgi:hypothetical protein
LSDEGAEFGVAEAGWLQPEQLQCGEQGVAALLADP